MPRMFKYAKDTETGMFVHTYTPFLARTRKRKQKQKQKQKNATKTEQKTTTTKI
jgi:hypothetical protein